MSIRQNSVLLVSSLSMWKIARNSYKTIQNCCVAQQKIKLSSTSLRQQSTAYDGDGKTKVSILNTELDMGLMITNFSQHGFRLNNNMTVMGPIVIFPKSILSWNVGSFEDINEESLSIFCNLDPKLDILIIGIGDQPANPTFSRRIIEFMKKYKINVEVLRTEQACTTFNFLNAENRSVASALIPPLHITYNENDVLQSKLKHKQLYEMD